MRGRGVEGEREENPLRNKWVQHPIFLVRFETLCSRPSLSLTHWSRDKMAAFSQMTSLNTFSRMKMYELAPARRQAIIWTNDG